MFSKRVAIFASLALIAIALAVFLRSAEPAVAQQQASEAVDGKATAVATPPIATPAPPVADRGVLRAMPRADAVPTPSPVAPRRRTALRGEPAAMPVSQEFLEKLVDASGKSAAFKLPDGSDARGSVDLIRRDARGILLVQGKLSAPMPGFYFFQRQNEPGKAGAMVGAVYFDEGEIAFRVDPVGPGGSPMLVAHPVDEVICRGLERPKAPEAVAGPETANAPQTHPIDIGIPDYQNGVVPLQSLPGAAAVVYLDFDGDPGPFAGWSSPISAAPSGASNAQIKEVWQMVAEDFQPFNINVTTDRKVYDQAQETRRQRVVITPSFNGGGVAFIGSFNWSGDTVCWSGYSTGKNAAEVISHEVGHTLHLGHDGRQPPGGEFEDYYGGGGSPYEVSWAPIMGVGYSANVTQWSKGEYPNPTNTQDDLALITNNNNDVDYRVDDYGPALATAGYLEIFQDNSVSNEGIIETSPDVDAFRFSTTGGSISLNIATVARNPNLDILAEIYSSANQLISSNNPDTQTGATISATLVAGEYTLRVSGVGRGNVASFGYSDYASLGAYLITGTVNGGVKPDRFNVVEHAPNGTSVGTVSPRNNHGSNPLTYTITSGNTSGAFSINATTGVITVANSSVLNFETLSTRWDDPAEYALFVSIADAANPTLNESKRVVIAITDVNEPPTISGGGSTTLLDHTRPGTLIRTLTGSDPDRFDMPMFSIVSGNTGGAFSIEPSTGALRFAADTDATVQSSYNLVISVTDRGAPALTASTTVNITLVHVPAGYSPGVIARTFFDNINGSLVSNLTSNSRFPNDPNSEVYLPSFDAGEHGDNYGSTMRGYVIPPVTGNYRFWLASDDGGELRISTSANPNSTTVIATVSGWTDPYDFTEQTSQQSAFITLQAGQPYYIEARQKDNVGGDHVTVAWQGPGFSREIISGLYLAPHYRNYAPKLTSGTLSVRENAYNGSTVGMLQVSDVNIGETHGSFTITGGTGASVFGVDAATGRIFVANSAALNAATTPSYTLQLRVTDSGTPALTGSVTATVNVIAAAQITATEVEQQIWDGIGGNNISALTGDSRYPNQPTRSRTLGSLDSGGDFGDSYGSRIRGYIVPPTTGSYRFYIASDDESRLLLSTNTSAASAVQIASVGNATGRNNWTAQTSQTSGERSLIAGQRYYFEILHKEGVGGDYVQVGWTGPGISTVTIVPGSALQPFDLNTAPIWSGAPYQFSTIERAAAGTRVGTLRALDSGSDKLTYTILSGNSSGAFALDPQTGDLTVANRTVLVPGQTVTLQVSVQDDGSGGRYPLRSTTTTASVAVRIPPSGSYEEAIVVRNPVAYWRFNETGGTVINDYYRAFNGTVSGALALNQAGPRPAAYPRFETNNTAAKFNGTNSFISVPALNLNSDTATFTAWVKRSGNATFFSAIAISRAGKSVAGLNFGAANELRYNWNDAPNTWNWNSGLVPPDNVWTFVALVVEPAKATIYMNSGSGLVSATNNVSHGMEEFDSTLHIGQDPMGGNRVFNGTIDDVAIFNRALSLEEIQALDSIASVTLSANDGTASEPGADTGEFTITRTGSTAEPLAVNFTLSGTAVRGEDYQLGVPALATTIPAGQGSVKVSLTALDDNAVEGSETVVLSLANGDYTLGTARIGIVTIDDNDVAPTVTITGPAEGATVGTANVALTATAADDGAPAALTLQWSKVSGPGTVTFTPANAANTSAAFSTPGTYVLRLTASDSALEGSDEITLTAQVSPIEQWRQQKFGADAANPEIAGDDKDPDRDGKENLVEYGLATEPLTADGADIQYELQPLNGDRHLTISIPRNPAATDITFIVEAGSDLRAPGDWTTGGTTVEENTPELLRVRDNTPVSTAAQRQMRLRITRP